MEAIPITPDEPENPGGPKGFSNPETLAKARETRERNRATPILTTVDGNGNPAQPVDVPASKEKQKRGRPPKRERNLDGMKQMLLATHLAIASFTQTPELELSEGEGLLLADKLAEVADYYNVSLGGKSGAIVGLVYALGVIYGPRAVVIIRKRKSANE